MILNMLHHDNVRIKKLEEGMKSVTNAQAEILKEIKDMKDMITQRFDG